MRIDSGIAEVNGTRLYYEQAGSGSAVVLIHGFSLDCRMWDDQFATLARRFRVIRYDLRGFGRSVPPTSDPYTPARDLKALLEYLDVGHAATVGLSLGGGIAIDFALAFPEATDALVVADTALTGYGWPHGRPSTGPVATAEREGVEAAKQFWLESDLFVPAAEQPTVLERLRHYVADYSGWHWLHDNPMLASEPPAIECLGSIRCPTLVILGERDNESFHDIARILRDGISNARCRVIPGAGHMSNMENPAVFNAALLEFLGSGTERM